MPVTVLASVALLAGCAAAGIAVCRIGGLGAVRGAAPAVGLALLMTVASPAARLLAGGGLALAAVAFVVLASLCAAPVRRVLAELLPDGAAVALPVVALLTLPWLAAGHDGLLGMGMNNDTPVHLMAIRWLIDHGMPEQDTLVAAGYPLGPHGLAAALSVPGLSLGSALTAVSMVAPPCAALAALDGLRELGPAARRGLAVVAGLGYMFVAYYAQMAFKETIEAALLLAFVLLLPGVFAAARAGGRAAARAALPVAVLLSGMVQTMSWAGLLWPAATVGAWLALECVLRRRSPRALLAGAAPVLRSGAVALLVLVSFELPRIVAFQSSRYAHEPDHGLGNLEGRISPWKALGVWLNPDFRFGTKLPVLTAALLVATGLLAVAGVRAWLRRGDRVLPAAMLAGWAMWVGLDLTKNGYNAAKALPIMAPLIALAVATGAVTVWRWAASAPAREGAPGTAAALATADGPEVRFAVAGLPPIAGRGSVVRALVAGVVGAGLLCSLWTLREAVVGVDAHARELRTLAAAAPPGRMLVLDNSDWIAWNLYGADVWRPPLLYAVHTAPIRGLKGWRGGDPYDLDSVSAHTLNQFTTVLTARNAAGSTPPPGLRVLRQTRSFVLWKRTGTIPPHRTLAEGFEPGAVLDCSTVPGARVAHRRGTAVVRPRPVIGLPESWIGTARDPGTSASQTLQLPPGSWDLSLQYVSRRPLDVSAGTDHTTLPANLDRLGPLFDIGTTRGGTVRVMVRQQGLDGLARALGTRGRTRALDSLRNQPLGALIATRHGGPVTRVPLAKACGRYVDWYTLG